MTPKLNWKLIIQHPLFWFRLIILSPVLLLILIGKLLEAVGQTGKAVVEWSEQIVDEVVLLTHPPFRAELRRMKEAESKRKDDEARAAMAAVLAQQSAVNSSQPQP